MVQPDTGISIDAPQGLSPLRRFNGTVESYEAVDKTANNDDGSTRNYKQVLFKFIEVEVLEATEPYPFPVAEVRVTYAPPSQSYGGTKWEALASSFRKLVDPGTQLDFLVGKRSQWAFLPAPLRSQVDNPNYDPEVPGSKRTIWTDVETDCWQIVSIEGVEKVDLLPLVISLADGKSEAEFNQAALTHPAIMKDPETVQKITDRVMLPGLLGTNQLTQDAEGVLHKVG